MFGNIKRYGSILGIVAVVAMLVTAAPFGYVMTDNTYTPEPDHGGEAEAIAPAVAGAAYVGGAAVGAVGGYGIAEYFEDGETAIESEIEESIDEATNDTLREGVHSSAITSEGTNEGFLDGVDNDINTIEGSLEQELNREYIREGDDILSEDEAVSVAESTASDYLDTTQSNLVETHNFHSHSVEEYRSQLHEADAADDIGAVEVYEVSNQTELDEARWDDAAVVEVVDDIEICDPDNWHDEDAVYYLNGHTIGFEDDCGLGGSSDAPIAVGSDAVVTVYGGGGHLADDGDETDDARKSIATNGVVNLYDVEFDSIEERYEDDGAYYKQNTNDDYVMHDDDGWDVVEIDEPSEYDAYNSITFDSETVANLNDAYDSADDVPVTEFESDGTVVELTAMEIQVSDTYRTDSIKVAVPYDAESGEIIDVESESVIIETTTSGIADYAEPVDFDRAVSLIEERDALSDDAFAYVEGYAQGVWHDTLEEVAADDEMSVTDVEHVEDDLGTLTVSAPDADNEIAVLSLYAGTYEGISGVVDNRVSVSDADGAYEDMVIFSTDMGALADQTDDPDVIAEGDEFGVDETRTLVVNPATGEVSDLEGTVTVDSVSVASNEDAAEVDIRSYNMESTDLSEQALRLQEQSEVTQQTASTEAAGGYVPDLSNSVTQLVTVLALLGVIFAMRKD